jgi:gluconolactonase
MDPIAGIAPVERIDGGFGFTEGPQWVPALGSLLFSDIPRDRIWRVTAPRTFQSFLNPSGNANGIALAPNGDLIICQHIGQVSRLFPDGGMTVIARVVDAGTLNSPNDAVVRSDGTIYFTDPTYGGTGTVGVRGVYRIAPDGTVSLIYGVTGSQPNGVTLSPDESILYVADSQASTVRRIELQPNGVPFSRPSTLFTNTSAGAPGGAGGDGITTDVNGNLYVTTSVGVKVYRPDAGYLGRIQVPQQPSNCAFGEADRRTLFITAQSGVYRVRLNVPGPY